MGEAAVWGGGGSGDAEEGSFFGFFFGGGGGGGGRGGSDSQEGTQFTCFTGTKVQILTPGQKPGATLKKVLSLLALLVQKYKYWRKKAA